MYILWPGFISGTKLGLQIFTVHNSLYCLVVEAPKPTKFEVVYIHQKLDLRVHKGLICRVNLFLAGLVFDFGVHHVVSVRSFLFQSSDWSQKSKGSEKATALEIPQ